VGKLGATDKMNSVEGAQPSHLLLTHSGKMLSYDLGFLCFARMCFCGKDRIAHAIPTYNQDALQG
jgi:hypothetical protein